MVEKMNKKEQIIKTGMKLFVKQGFENTPTSQISKEAKVGTGTLFRYFKTKEILINEIYLYIKKDIAKNMFNRITDNLEVKEQLKRMWIDLSRWAFDNKIKNQFYVKFFGTSYINELTIEQLHADFNLIEKAYNLGQKNKLLRNISYDLFINLTMNMFQSFFLEFIQQKKLNKKVLEESFDIYWNAIKRPN